MKNILCFAAHPDDLEFSCIGTLKKMSDKGYSLIYVIITNGENGYKLENQNRIERINTRKKEQDLAANKLNVKKKFGVSVEYGKNKLAFTISDEGIGFDFENVPDPTKPGNVEKPDGRGVFLMNHLADKIEYLGNGNILKLHFNINKSD